MQSGAPWNRERKKSISTQTMLFMTLQTVDLKSYYVQGKDSYVAHFSPPKPENQDKQEDGSIVATFLFPYAA